MQINGITVAWTSVIDVMGIRHACWKYPPHGVWQRLCLGAGPDISLRFEAYESDDVITCLWCSRIFKP